MVKKIIFSINYARQLFNLIYTEIRLIWMLKLLSVNYVRNKFIFANKFIYIYKHNIILIKMYND